MEQILILIIIFYFAFTQMVKAQTNATKKDKIKYEVIKADTVDGKLRLLIKTTDNGNNAKTNLYKGYAKDPQGKIFDATIVKIDTINGKPRALIKGTVTNKK
ncbi:MAG: hypothetical protein ACFFDY_07370 [Candidatus Thorarchaeota archaeon]